MTELTHFDEDGASRMVNVGAKKPTQRIARAEAVIDMELATRERIASRSSKKGDVIEVARLAGIMAVKRTSDLIPLCHPLIIDGVTVDVELPQNARQLRILATVETFGKTGVEMEALVAASTAALTVYDMCKAVDRGMTIQTVRLLEKSGGKSGHYQRDDDATQNDET